ADGTVLLKGGSYPFSLANVNGRLFFRDFDAEHGGELWTSDGTPAGTVLAQDIVPGPNSSNPDQLTVFNGMLFFSAQAPAPRTELWRLSLSAAADTPSPPENTAVTVRVLANDLAAAGSIVTATSVPAHGSVVINPDN